MDDSRRRAIQFLEKEIKTYLALSLFLSKKGIKADARRSEKSHHQSLVLQRENEGSEETCL